MINDMQTILEILDMQGDNRLKDTLARGIDLAPFQANLLFLKRGYGKTYMSYIEMANDILKYMNDYGKDSVIIGESTEISKKYVDFNPIYYDTDILNHNMLRNWLMGFEAFIKEYFKEFTIEFKDNITAIITKENK